ncbi:MAG: GNAT family N-acetyltransferase [Chloroflexi bacterium]|nr:GNAT family N-acetyltransferase [Chloroflexota bacterium]
MINELEPMAYDGIRPLFQPLSEYLLFCAGVVEGNYEGRVFVDDLAAPTSTFMVTRGIWCYLAGEPDNQPFNQALNTALLEKQFLAQNVRGILLCCQSNGWGERLEIIFPSSTVHTFGRRRYILPAFSRNWRAEIPDGFTIRQIDAEMGKRPSAELPDDVQDLIALWKDAPNPDEKGFGFVALYQDKIVCHVVIDCLVNGMGDVGLVTHEDYRQRGLATVTSAAAIEYGLSHGLSLINWDCATQNEPSVRTAEKLGFAPEREHTMYFIELATS